VHGDDVTELGSEQASVPYFRRKEHCSRGLKRGRGVGVAITNSILFQ